MLDPTNTSLRFLIIHRIGNKSEDQGVRLSIDFTQTENDALQDALVRFFFHPFKTPEYFQFSDDSGLENNPMYRYSQDIFAAPGENFIKTSGFIANLLYDASEHPSIKAGDLCVALFGHVGSEGKFSEALGVFKIENSDEFLQLEQNDANYEARLLEGISLDSLDKACIILNQEAEEGYKISCVNKSSNVQQATYWKDDFLALNPRKDSFFFTQQAANLTREFVLNELSNDYVVSRADQINLLNRSKEFFTSQDKFDESDYGQQVFQDEAVAEKFEQYAQRAAQEQGFSFKEDFPINEHAVKKASGIFKSILKLDKNFHVYIHGNKDRIERGVEPDGRKYYKLYYDAEN